MHLGSQAQVQNRSSVHQMVTMRNAFTCGSLLSAALLTTFRQPSEYIVARARPRAQYLRLTLHTSVDRTVL